MLDDNPDLTVPKHPVAVELVQAGRPAMRARLYIAEHEAHAPGPEDVFDLLEKAEEFLPARDEERRMPLLIQKRSLVYLAMPAPSSDALPDEGLYSHRREVRVELSGAAALVGEILYTPPNGEARLVDHLNGASRFFTLWTADRLYLVNKAMVERVTETPLDLAEE